MCCPVAVAEAEGHAASIDVENDREIPEMFLKYCVQKANDFPSRKTGRQQGWNPCYPGTQKRRPKLTSFIFNFPDPTLLPGRPS